MIKGTFFSKLLKQSLFISLISCFILLGNFSSAVGGNQWGFLSSHLIGQYNLNQEYTIPTLTNSTFTLKDNANFYFSNDVLNGNFYYIQFKNPSNKYNNFLYFWNDNKLYIALQLNNDTDNVFIPGNYQGYVEYLCYVDNLLDTPDSTQVYCNVQSSGNPNVITVSDFINDSQFSNPDKLTFLNNGELYSLCFTYNDLGKSYCAGLYGKFTSSTSYYTAGNLISSSAFPSDIYNQSYITCSPWGCSSNGGDQDNPVIVDNCTYNDIFNFLNLNGYNDYLCYGGLDNFNLYDSTITYNPVPLSGKSLGQILSYSNAWDTPNDWFIFWNGLYLDKNNSIYNSMWESYPAVYRTWFDFYYRFGGSTLVFDSVREYCAMRQLDVDFDITLYKGQYFKNTCHTIKMNYGSGDFENAVGVDWDGVGNNGSGSTVYNDPVVFIQNFFGQLKDNFPTRYDLGGGFLPVYIITFLCAIVLFRFLSH